MKLMIKPVFSLIVVSVLSVASASLFAEQGKCSPCQAAKSIRDEIKQSIKDAAAAVLAAGGAYTREQELDMSSDICAKCGCSKPRPPRYDESGQSIETEKCGCSRTNRDELIQDLESTKLLTVAACCEFCAEPGSLGCQGKNAFRCNTCQQGLIRMSIIEATEAVLGATVEEVDAVLTTVQTLLENELDAISNVLRAPREELADPCDPCGPTPVCEVSACVINNQLRALRCCCESLTQRVSCQGAQARKCCKKLKHKIEDVTELVETVIDQSAACCSVTETVLGDPLTASILDIPLCQSVSATDVLINSTDADVMTWLKSIYELIYRVHSCVCCIE